jgi:hypothetical protein
MCGSIPKARKDPTRSCCAEGVASSSAHEQAGRPGRLDLQHNELLTLLRHGKVARLPKITRDRAHDRQGHVD